MPVPVSKIEEWVSLFKVSGYSLVQNVAQDAI